MFKKNKGFTLIELLVVIAIIGILATIVIVNVNSARNRANDVAIKAALAQVRPQAELWYDYNGFSYNSLATSTVNTTAGVDMLSIYNSIIANTGSGYAVWTTSSAYCAKVTLKTTGAGDWCVDSTGYAGASSTLCTSAANSKCK